MLILHVVPPSRGGIRQHVTSLVTGLGPERFRSALARLTGPADEAEAPGAAPPAPTFTLGPPQAPATVARLARLIRELAPDVVHCHGSRAALAAGLAAGWPPPAGGVRVPLIQTVHGVSAPNTPWKQALVRAAERRLAAGISAHIAVSRWVAAGVIRDWGVPADRVHVIPNGVDAARFAVLPDARAARRSLGLDADAPVVGMAGRLAREKGPDVFLRAARLVHLRRPECRFLVAGDGPESASLRRLAASLGLGGSVSFAGEVRDVAVALAAMDVFVLPSRLEAISIGLLEAMAAGRPVVAAAVGGVPEVARHRQTALLLPADDPYGLAQAVTDLLRDAALRERLSRAARTRIAADYTLRAMLERTEHVYTVVAARGRARRGAGAAGVAAAGA